MNYIEQGTPNFRRITAALFIGNFVTFTVLYNVQPLLPTFSQEFHIIPAIASFALSATTATLACFMVVAGTLSEAWGRKSIMIVTLLLSSILAFLSAFSPNFVVLLVFRTLLGIFLAGLPPTAMAYLGEEISPKSLGLAMGIFVSAASFGGMVGRISTGILADLYSWRVALGIIGLASLLGGCWIWRSLPSSANFHRRPLMLKELMQSLLWHLRDARLLCLYGAGFLLLGGFVAIFNYLGYQLTAPPYSLSQAVVGWIFLVYLMGTFSSTWMGRLADRMSRHRILSLGVVIMLVGAVITLDQNLYVKILGIAIYTFGFYGCHSIASSWVGKLAVIDKAQASSLYLFFFYLGSSVGGPTGGVFWSHYGWGGVIAMNVCFLLLTLLLLMRLAVVSTAR